MSDEETVVTSALVEKSDSTARVYELGYHLVPSYKEDEAIAEAANIRDMIEKKGGTIIAEELPKEMELAYEMVKDIANKPENFTRSFFGWVKFDIEPAVALEIKDSLVRDDRLVRYLLIKTVRENTLASKRVGTMGTRKRYTPRRDEEGPAVEINKEEVDNKLDELLKEE